MKIPRIETLIILVFLGCVALWAISKCSARRADLVHRVRDLTDSDHEERPLRRDTVRVPVAPNPTPAPVNTQSPAPTPPPQASPATTPAPSSRAPRSPGDPTTQTTAPGNATQQQYSTLYVTIDGLKMRKQPNLKAEVVTKLELYEPVTFLNKKSEKPEEISLGYEKVTDHWIKVRSKSGKEGWVFGAGVHYYKMKRKGVME
jgi:hypothetical protein